MQSHPPQHPLAQAQPGCAQNHDLVCIWAPSLTGGCSHVMLMSWNPLALQKVASLYSLQPDGQCHVCSPKDAQLLMHTLLLQNLPPHGTQPVMAQEGITKHRLSLLDQHSRRRKSSSWTPWLSLLASQRQPNFREAEIMVALGLADGLHCLRCCAIVLLVRFAVRCCIPSCLTISGLEENVDVIIFIKNQNFELSSDGLAVTKHDRTTSTSRPATQLAAESLPNNATHMPSARTAETFIYPSSPVLQCDELQHLQLVCKRQHEMQQQLASGVIHMHAIMGQQHLVACGYLVPFSAQHMLLRQAMVHVRPPFASKVWRGSGYNLGLVLLQELGHSTVPVQEGDVVESRHCPPQRSIVPLHLSPSMIAFV